MKMNYTTFCIESEKAKEMQGPGNQWHYWRDDPSRRGEGCERVACYLQSNMEKGAYQRNGQAVIVTLLKKGDLSQCSYYRTIALLGHVGKVLITVLLDRLKAQIEKNLSEEQAGFRRDRSTVQKTMTTVFWQENIIEELMISSTWTERVTEFMYLGSLLTCDNDCCKEMKRRIARVTGVMARFKKVWNSMHISTRTKFSIIRTCVMNVYVHVRPGPWGRET